MPVEKLIGCLAPEYTSRALALGQLVRFVVVVVVVVVVFTSLQFVVINMKAQQP